MLFADEFLGWVCESSGLFKFDDLTTVHIHLGNICQMVLYSKPHLNRFMCIHKHQGSGPQGWRTRLGFSTEKLARL